MQPAQMDSSLGDKLLSTALLRPHPADLVLNWVSLFLIEVQLIYNVVLVSGVQHSDSDT